MGHLPATAVPVSRQPDFSDKKELARNRICAIGAAIFVLGYLVAFAGDGLRAAHLLPRRNRDPLRPLPPALIHVIDIYCPRSGFQIRAHEGGARGEPRFCKDIGQNRGSPRRHLVKHRDV